MKQPDNSRVVIFLKQVKNFERLIPWISEDEFFNFFDQYTVFLTALQDGKFGIII